MLPISIQGRKAKSSVMGARCMVMRGTDTRHHASLIDQQIYFLVVTFESLATGSRLWSYAGAKDGAQRAPPSVPDSPLPCRAEP
jgi:hypothetical protein